MPDERCRRHHSFAERSRTQSANFAQENVLRSFLPQISTQILTLNGATASSPAYLTNHFLTAAFASSTKPSSTLKSAQPRHVKAAPSQHTYLGAFALRHECPSPRRSRSIHACTRCAHQQRSTIALVSKSKPPARLGTVVSQTVACFHLHACAL